MKDFTIQIFHAGSQIPPRTLSALLDQQWFNALRVGVGLERE